MARVAKDSDTNIKLAVYMERLDGYISSQTALNESLCKRMEVLDEQLKELSFWRTKIYGAKTALVAAGILIVHTAAIMGSFVALITWFNR